MARHTTRAALATRNAFASLGSAAALVLMLGAPPALAVEEPAVWKPLSLAEPTHMVPGSPRDEVQELKVDASGGTYTIRAHTPDCFSPEVSKPIPYNATHEQLQATLEELGGCFSGNPPVTTGGPGGPGGGTPYVITFTGPENGNRPVELLETTNSGLTGGAAKASVTEVTRGAREGMIVISATDVGGTTDESTVTVEDNLPAGFTPTEISGYDAYLSRFGSEGKGEVEMTCSPNPETERPLRCSIKKTEIITGDSLIVAIHVKVTGATGSEPANEVTVSGGGGEPASATNPVVISETPAGYGPAPGSVIAAVSTHQAGAHASVTTAFTMNTNEFGHVTENEKDIRFDLPPGLVGDVKALPKCPISQVLSQLSSSEDPCPVGSMVGMVTLYINLVPGSAPIGFTTPLFAIPPAPGEPAAFAFDALLLPVRLDSSVLSGGASKEEGSYGVRVTAPSLSEAAETFSNWITIWGVPADHNGPSPNPAVERKVIYGWPFGGPERKEVRAPLLSNPQVCGEPMEVTMSTDSWPHSGNFFYQAVPAGSFVGCEALSMQPSFTMLPDTLEAGAPAGYTLNLKVPQKSDPDALVTPTVRNVSVALPVGAVISPSFAWGLRACSDEEFGLHSGRLAECPRESQVGEVDISSSALPEKEEDLRGNVYIASPLCGLCTPEDAQDGKMVRLFVQAVGQGESGIIIKLEGKASINQQTGQITATFEEDPPLPFDEFKLILGGGPRAALANPRECGPATTNMEIAPWSFPFTEDSAPSYTFQLDHGCFAPQFNPTLVAGTTSIQAGEYSPFTLSFGRSDKDGFLAGLQQELPAGLLGKIAGVTLCPEPQAGEGTCPEASLVGHLQVLTGPGADPFLVTGGKVFLTGGYKGAPFGLSLVVPAVAGPYTLSGTTGRGTVVVRAAINVDKRDAHLTITADPLPVALDGIPLQLRVIDVVIDRNEFTFNPTSCDRMAIQTTLTSLEGAAVGVSTPFHVTNCVGLGFNPHFEVATSGHTSRTEGASLDARLIYPSGRKLANVKSVKVELPKQLPSRLTTLQRACPDTVFAANPENCPAASRVGQARASTPILPNELDGWAYFVSHGGAAYPDLTVVLQDRQDGVRVDLVGETFISKAGITSTSFGTVPDVPISSFELYLPEGPNSALAASVNLCESPNLVMPTIFNAQNGAVLRQNTPIAVTGCPHVAKAKHAHRGHAAKHKHKHKKRKHRKAMKAHRARTATGRGK